MDIFSRLGMMYLGLLATTQVFAVDDMKSSIQAICPVDGPKVIGPYSPGIVTDLSHGKLLFVSGHLPVDPQTGQKIESSIQEATRQTMENIERVLIASGSSFDHVLRVDVFLRDMKEFPGMNEEYAKYFPNGHFPARQTIQSNIPALIEISCIALVPLEK